MLAAPVFQSGQARTGQIDGGPEFALESVAARGQFRVAGLVCQVLDGSQPEIGQIRYGVGLLGKPHVLLIGARGMGKTTMLLMLRFAVREGDLREKWQPVRFPEESYAVTDLADFSQIALPHGE